MPCSCQNQKITGPRLSIHPSCAIPLLNVHIPISASPRDSCGYTLCVNRRYFILASRNFRIRKHIDPVVRFLAYFGIGYIRFHPDIRRLNISFSDGKLADKLPIHKIADRIDGSEIAGQMKHISTCVNPRFHLVINGNIRAAETIDGLFRVSYEEQGTRLWSKLPPIPFIRIIPGPVKRNIISAWTGSVS